MNKTKMELIGEILSTVKVKCSNRKVLLLYVFEDGKILYRTSLDNSKLPYNKMNDLIDILFKAKFESYSIKYDIVDIDYDLWLIRIDISNTTEEPVMNKLIDRLYNIEKLGKIVNLFVYYEGELIGQYTRHIDDFLSITMYLCATLGSDDLEVKDFETFTYKDMYDSKANEVTILIN